jgi:hypothetical protein
MHEKALSRRSFTDNPRTGERVRSQPTRVEVGEIRKRAK